jgi:hypothetical protein
MDKSSTNPAGQSDLMSADEVFEHLGSIKQLKRLAWSCVLPAERVNGEWKFRRADLEAWIRDQKRADTDE